MSRLERQKQGSFSLSSSSSWTRQIKVLMFLHVLVGFPVGQFDEVHEYTKKTVCYSKEREDKRLNTTVHRHVVAMSEFLCAVQCYHDSCCRSANFMKIPAQSDGRNNCELLHAIASKDNVNVVENKTYNHLVLVEPKKPFNCSCSTCKNNGSCQESSNKCICPGGLTGERCETDINECSGSNSCATNATCNNTVGSYTCECKKGFTGNGTSCTDIDECGSNPCHKYAKCNNTFGSYTCECKKGFSGNGTFCTAKNCKELRQTGIIQDGVHLIDPDGLGSFNVSCDMKTDEGGWTVFQRRIDGSVDFFLGWKEYKSGFGNMSGEFWLGLDKIHRLTKNSETELRVDLEDFDGGNASAKYKIFKVDAENESYTLTVGNFVGRSACRVNTTNGECCIFPLKLNKYTIYYSCITTTDRKIPWCATTGNYSRDKKWGNCSNPWPGDAGDSLTLHNGMKFSTKDKDNDVSPHAACADFYKGGWWFKTCVISNLNGEYHQPGQSLQRDRGVNWRTWKGRGYSLKKTEMKIRPQKP